MRGWQNITDNNLFRIAKTWGHTEADPKASHIISSFVYREMLGELRLLLRGKKFGRNTRRYEDDEIKYAIINIDTDSPVSQEMKRFEMVITKNSPQRQPRTAVKALNIADNAYKACMEFFDSGHCVRLKEISIYIWCEGSNEDHAYTQYYAYEDDDGLFPQLDEWVYDK